MRTEPIWTRCYCVAIVGAGVAVAGTAASVYQSSQAGKGTAAAQGAINSNPAGAYGTRMEEVQYKNNVKLPKYKPQAGADDYFNALPLLTTIGRTSTKVGAGLRDILTGGKASENLKLAGADINSELQGRVPQDVVDKTNRIVAERTGAGAFTAGGNQQSATDFARSIGQTSSGLVEAGLSHAPQWEALVGSFTYTPQQAGQDALSWLRQRNDYVNQQAGLQFQIDQQQYTADLNNAKIRAGGDPQVQGQIADNLKLSTLQAQQSKNQTDALLGLVKTGVGAVGAIGGGGGNTGLADSGFYTSQAAAAAAGGAGAGGAYYGGTGQPGASSGWYITPASG